MLQKKAEYKCEVRGNVVRCIRQRGIIWPDDEIRGSRDGITDRSLKLDARFIKRLGGLSREGPLHLWVGENLPDKGSFWSLL